MDHGHAHPCHDPPPVNLANNDLNSQQTPNRPLSFLGISNTSSTLRRSPQTLFETPLSLPQRRLQLRNAGFRATRLPSHRLSTRISRWFSERDDHNSRRSKPPGRNQENSPPTVRRQDNRGSHTHSSILQEITNSARSRQSDESAFVPIVQEDQDDSPTHSWYHDAPSTQQSPIAFDAIRDYAGEMKLREISGNAQPNVPPLGSPLARQVRGQSKRSLTLRKTSFPASEHIVFLETKLEESEKSQYSPKTGLPLKDKIKALSTENGRLKEMLVELEHQFETRLRDSVEHKTGLEMSLRRRIKHLEDEVGSKDCTIRELEYRNDVSQRDLSSAGAWRVAVERLESEKRGLEETNHSLEKRNDVLTELLGQSPTRAHHGFELPSPTGEQRRRTPRPRSMMPRIPSSPSRSASNRPLSLHAAPSPFQHDYFSPLSAVLKEKDHPFRRGNIDLEKADDDSHSIDSGLGESCSVRSGNEPMSKRSSMHSYASASPAPWGLPLPPSPTEDAMERSSRKRKTRRFASGSTQLKPLVLPTLNPTTSLPQSAPLPVFYSVSGHREISEHSIDPTISFLSRSHDTSRQPMPRANNWAAEGAMKALEGPSETRLVSADERVANRETRQSIPEAALTFQDLRDYSDHNSDSILFSPSLIDEAILEEGGAAFLSNQAAGAGHQSFSSLTGEISIAGFDTDKAHAGKEILTTQSLESEPPHPISAQLSTFPESSNQLARTMGDNVDQRSPSVGELLPEFANPLSSPYLLSNVDFLDNEASCRAERPPTQPAEQEGIPTQSSTMESPCERPTEVQTHCTGFGLQTAELMMPNPLMAAPSQSNHKRPKRAHSALDLLQRKGSPTVPLTSVNNRTILGTISRYTSYMRDIRQDPTAVARRVIANAWCSNWKRLGKLSWWVLGLFLGHGWKQGVDKRQGWEAYDGETIAQAEHERLNGPGPTCVQDTSPAPCSKIQISRQWMRPLQKRVEFNIVRKTDHPAQKEGQNVQELRCKSCEQRSKASWGKSLYLWSKFSVAIMLAVGGAVIKGPEEMLKDCDLHNDAALVNRPKHVHDSSGTDHDTLFDHSLELQEDDEDYEANVDDDVGVNNAISEQTSRTAKSVTGSRHRKQPLLPPRQPHFTFRASLGDGYDHVDDNGQPRPSKGRVSALDDAAIENGPQLPAQLRSNDETKDDLGTLQWTRNLSVDDFEAPLQDNDDFGEVDSDRDRTIRANASPRRLGLNRACSSSLAGWSSGSPSLL